MATRSDTQPSPSGFPPAMGPGARPVGQNDPGSVIKELAMIRSKYSWSQDDNSLTLGYEIQDVPRRYKIPFDAMRHGAVSMWIFYGGPIRTRVTSTLIIDMMRGMENVMGRSVTQTEAEALAFHAPQRIKYAQFGTAFGFGFGYWLAWRGRKEMKFPMLKPKPLERYDNFPNRFLPILRGGFARTMWHITRGNIYAGIGLLAFQPIFSTLGQWSTAVGILRDARLADINQAIKTSDVTRIRSNRANQSTPYAQQKPQPQSNDQQYSDPDPQGYYKDTESGVRNDYSGGQNYSSDNSYTNDTTDTATLSDMAMRQQESQQGSPTSYGRNSRQTSRSVPVQQPDGFSSSSSSDFLFNDDASPTAGNEPDPSMYSGNRSVFSRQNSNPQSKEGSAWNQVRRGQGNEQSQSQGYMPPQDQRDSFAQNRGWQDTQRQGFESRTDSFSFSKDDEDRQLAKQQAQREFDQMLDRERQESGSGDYDRGSFAAGTGAESPSAASGGGAWDKRRRG